MEKERKEMIKLLKEYSENKKDLHKIESSLEYKEWRFDFEQRIKYANGFEIREKPKRLSKSSHEENLIMESEAILSRIDRIKNKINAVDLLMVKLNKEEREMIKMKYLDKKEIFFIADSFYVSKATLYRKISKILDKMEKNYSLIKEMYLDFPQTEKNKS